MKIPFFPLLRRRPRPLDSRRLACIKFCLATVIFGVCVLAALGWTISADHLMALSSPFVAAFTAVGVISGASGAAFAAEHWGAAAPSSWIQNAKMNPRPASASEDPGQEVA